MNEKKLCHFCLTAHNEVLLRSLDDAGLFTNHMALEAWRCNVDLLADSIMSTHLHEVGFSSQPRGFARAQSISMTKAFNSKYGRKGPLFDGTAYILELHGPRHIQMAINYSLRQGMHHGVSETPFSYPFGSCNSLFRSPRGLAEEVPVYTSRADIRDLLPKNADFPDEWCADSNGILLRRSFEQLQMTENWYGSARSFLFSMTRRTSEEWLEEQKKDGVDDPPVTLDIIEGAYSAGDIAEMLAREGNPKYVFRAMDDMSVCSIIDNDMLGRFSASSVYALSDKQKRQLAAELWNDVGIRSEAQISRCLAMKYPGR